MLASPPQAADLSAPGTIYAQIQAIMYPKTKRKKEVNVFENVVSQIPLACCCGCRSHYDCNLLLF